MLYMGTFITLQLLGYTSVSFCHLCLYFWAQLSTWHVEVDNEFLMNRCSDTLAIEEGRQQSLSEAGEFSQVSYEETKTSDIFSQ